MHHVMLSSKKICFKILLTDIGMPRKSWQRKVAHKPQEVYDISHLSKYKFFSNFYGELSVLIMISQKFELLLFGLVYPFLGWLCFL